MCAKTGRERRGERELMFMEGGRERERNRDRVYVLRERRGEKERISSERETIPR